jgi:Rubredoxin.
MSDFKKYQCRECEHIYDEAKGEFVNESRLNDVV